jgi:hypothetical protein
MSVRFTSITYEVYISGAWVDLTPDVLANPSPHGSRGIQSAEFGAWVADVGRLTFSLNNSDENSAGLVGYYSPGHANCLTGWTTSLPVRLKFAYAAEGWIYIKWYGRIEPDGITVVPGVYGPRHVNVSCADWMKIASDHKLDLLTLSTSKYVSQAIPLLLANMPIQPQRTSYYYEDPSIFSVLSVVFDVGTSETTAISELQKLGSSQELFVYLDGGEEGETLKTNSNSTDLATGTPIPLVTASCDTMLFEDGDVMLYEDGDVMIFDDNGVVTVSDLMDGTEISYGRYLANYITVTNYPRRVDAASTTVLWTLEEATQITARQSVTLRVSYRDPTSGASRVNCYAGTAPVRNTDFKAYANRDGTGTDYSTSMTMTCTFGSNEAEIIITNTHASASFYTGGEDIICQIRGKGIYTYDAVKQVYKDATSIATHGLHTMNVDQKYQVTANGGAGYTNWQGRVSILKTPFTNIETAAMCANRDAANISYFLYLCEPRRVATFTETVAGIDRKFVVCGYEFDIVDGNTVYWKAGLKYANTP